MGVVWDGRVQSWNEVQVLADLNAEIKTRYYTDLCGATQVCCCTHLLSPCGSVLLCNSTDMRCQVVYPTVHAIALLGG